MLAISSHPLPTLQGFLASRRDELLRADIPSLLKALELSGHWEWALALLRWAGAEGAADAAALEMVVRALGREGQHDAICDLLDEMPLPPGSRLDVRAYTTVLHALSRAGRYERALQLFAELRRQGVAPTLVTYNVVLDVYGRMGRSWPQIVALLEEMRAAGVEPDDFTASTVIAACCRDGLVDEALTFFEDLKARGHTPCVVTYNALLQVFGKAGNYPEALRVLKEMEQNGCQPDAVTYNELAGTYARAGFYEEAAKCLGTMTGKGLLPNTFTYNAASHACLRRKGYQIRVVERLVRLDRPGRAS